MTQIFKTTGCAAKTLIELLYDRLMGDMNTESYMQTIDRHQMDLHCYETLVDDQWLCHDTAGDWRPWILENIN